MTAFTAGDSSGRRSVSDGGGLCRCAQMAAKLSLRWNGAWPVSNSNTAQASAYWSVRPSTGRPSICSGAV